MQPWEIISLGFQHEFFFCLFVLFSFENAHFPLRSLISVRKITNWPMKSSQRCLCIKAAVRNHFFRLSERDFLFYSCLKNGLSAIWKRFQHEFFFVYLFLFSFENAHFSLRSLILVKKITHVDRRNLHRNVFVLRQRWEIISFQNEFFVLFVFEKLFTSNLKMHIRKKRPTKI